MLYTMIINGILKTHSLQSPNRNYTKHVIIFEAASYGQIFQDV